MVPELTARPTDAAVDRGDPMTERSRLRTTVRKGPLRCYPVPCASKASVGSRSRTAWSDFQGRDVSAMIAEWGELLREAGDRAFMQACQEVFPSTTRLGRRSIGSAQAARMLLQDFAIFRDVRFLSILYANIGISEPAPWHQPIW